jgi:hypothetical protein
VARPVSGTIAVLVIGGEAIASWPLPGTGRPNLAMVDELARLQLAAKRLGGSVEVRCGWPALTALLALIGLDDVLADGLRVEMAGQAEGGEEVGVEEVVQPDDPVR